MLLTCLGFGAALQSFAQNQGHLLDLRTCGKSCSSSNYSIESVYLSDVTGNPITSSLLTCTPGVEQTTYISFIYQTSSGSGVSNGRLFADLSVGESTMFLNYYFGNIPPAKTTADTLTLSAFPLNWVCGEEVILSNSLLAWTPSGSADLSTTYICNDYPTAQCQFTSDIVVDAPLAVQFEYSYDCPENGTSTVYFTSTTNGGREAYTYSWSFTNATISSSTLADPIVEYNESGTAELTVTDANGTQNTYNVSVEVPEEIDLTGTVTDHTDDENPDGAISLDINSTGNYTFAWTGPGGFTSDQQNISELIAGDYFLTVTDSFGCFTERTFEVLYFGALPITWGKMRISLSPDQSEAILDWTTYKETASSHFEIQKSVGNINNFEPIAEVNSVGNSQDISHYTFKDKILTSNGQRIYYRIRQYNLDGSSEYSETISAIVPEGTQKEADWIIYPNPYKENALWLHYLGPVIPDSKKLKIRLISAAMTTTTEIEWNNNAIDLKEKMKNLPNGLVILEIHYGNMIQRLKLIIR
ncbi:hypothetical protein [Cyclobacterium plantarum]|uniref:hypothetical protein n=1 Tax=Cyclobacterium plantarum TaxID=2716263 RepID=UPI003F70B619